MIKMMKDTIKAIVEGIATLVLTAIVLTICIATTMKLGEIVNMLIK